MMVQKFRREEWQEGGGLPPPGPLLHKYKYLVEFIV